MRAAPKHVVVALAKPLQLIYTFAKLNQVVALAQLKQVVACAKLKQVVPLAQAVA